MPLWMLTIMVAGSKVYDAEGTVSVMSGHHATLLELCHYLIEVVRSCRYHLQYAPGIILCREEDVPFLLTKQEGMYFI